MKISISSAEGARIFRFIFWGALNTAIGFGAYSLLAYLGAYLFLASLVSLIVGILLGHYFSKRNVFRSTSKNTIRKYVVSWAGIYLINLTLLYSFVTLGIDKYSAGLFAGLLLVPASYITQKLLVFR